MKGTKRILGWVLVVVGIGLIVQGLKEGWTNITSDVWRGLVLLALWRLKPDFRYHPQRGAWVPHE